MSSVVSSLVLLPDNLLIFSILTVYLFFPSDNSSVKTTFPSLSFLSSKTDISNFTGSLFLSEYIVNCKHLSELVKSSLDFSKSLTKSSKNEFILSTVKSGSSVFWFADLASTSSYAEINEVLYFFKILYLSKINFFVVSSFFTKSTNLLIKLYASSPDNVKE